MTPFDKAFSRSDDVVLLLTNQNQAFNSTRYGTKSKQSDVRFLGKLSAYVYCSCLYTDKLTEGWELILVVF